MELGVATGSTISSAVSRFYERAMSKFRRQREDDSGVSLELRRPKPMSLQVFRSRFLKDMGHANINGTGSLAQLPVEIQLETFFYLDYWSLANLRETSKYYQHFISEQMLEDSKDGTRDMYMEMEREYAFPTGQKPCYTCLRVRYNGAFHDPSVASRGYATGSTQTSPPFGQRYCIPCGVKNKKFKPGEPINAGGVQQAICKHCKRFNHRPVQSYVVRSGWACPKCDAEVSFLQSQGPVLRLAQAIFAIIIFALACSGRAVPRSSHLTHGTWRWVFTMSLDLFTIGACVNSWFFRSTAMDKGSSVRDDDYTFFLPIEVLGFLGWAAVVVGLIWEALHPLYKNEFDRIAIALTVMSAFQCLFFLATTLLSSSTLVRRCCVRNVQDEYP